jgi:hypothetical protein
MSAVGSKYKNNCRELGMTIKKLASGSFVLLQAEWLAAKSINLINHLGPTHIIVRYSGPQTAYFLYTRREALSLLDAHGASTNLVKALGLENRRATPLVDGAETAVGVPDRCIVVEDGSIIGFFDASYTASTKRRRGRGGNGKGSSQKQPASLKQSSLVAELPKMVAVGETVSLLIYLSSALTPDSALPIALAQGEIVEIVIQTRRGFELEGRGEGQLTVSSKEETLPIQFKLKAVAPGLGLVRVLAFHQGQPLGVVSLSPTISEASEARDTATIRDDQPLTPASVHLPDLSLLILEEYFNGSLALSLRLTAADSALGLNFKKYELVPLRLDPLRYFQEFFRDIEGLPLETGAEKMAAAEHLAAKGMSLFETVIPESLRDEIWRLRGRIRSVQVQSEEPWIPWELCKMSGDENGRVVEGPFFCEAFSITRWLPGVPLKRSLSLKNVALVVPRDSGLAYAQAERNYILSLASVGSSRVTQIPATFLDVRSALASGEYDGLHFSGHGILHDSDPNRSAMVLENEGDLTPEDLSGVVRNMGRARPVVFLNACLIGRQAMSLTDIGGWAAAFLRAGAGAFVGAYWSVYDKPAFDFARAFYERLLGGAPIGEAAREARAAIRGEDNSTWLAYTVFADPLATLHPGS